MFALTGARIFDGTDFHGGHAVVVDGTRISAVMPEAGLPGGIVCERLNGGYLAPGFIDVQVNGGGGALLNDAPNAAAVRRIAEAHRRFGTTAMLPTVITDSPAVLAQAIAAIRAAQAQNVPGILGIHIEGPFLDAARKGAHEAHFIRAMQDSDVAQIAHADCGIVMLTLAPNCVSPAHIGTLAQGGVLVSLGHSDATHAQIQPALAAGARAFTHLFNAMSQMSAREPGMAGTALADGESYCGLIADGFHVHDANMRLALAAKPKDRIMLVSDAMPAAAGGPDVFYLQGRRVRREEGRLLLDDGTLAGSNLTMDAAVRHCVEKLGTPLAQALQMASLNAAAFLRRDHEMGRIQAGYLASFVHLGEDLAVRKTWINGG